MIINDYLKNVKISNHLKNSAHPNVANENCFDMYFLKLYNIALAQFEWENLPTSIDARYLEILLLTRGECVCFKHNTNDRLMVLNVANNGGLNDYHNLVNFRAYGLTGTTQQCNIDNAVVGYNNYSRQPSTVELEQFAMRLADIQRTIDVRLLQHKVPMLYRTSKNGLLSAKRLFNKLINNEASIYIEQSSELDMGSTLNQNNEIAYIIDKLYAQKKEVWNEAMLFLGVDNSKTDKKERMIVDEVKSNNEQIEMCREIQLISRREFAEKINKMFGTNISVKYRLEQNKAKMSESEVDENGYD